MNSLGKSNWSSDNQTNGVFQEVDSKIKNAEAADKEQSHVVVEEKSSFTEASDLALHYPHALIKRHFSLPEEAAARLFNYLPRKNGLSLVNKSLYELNKAVNFFPLLRTLPEVKQEMNNNRLLYDVSETMGIRNDAELARYLASALKSNATEYNKGMIEEALPMLETLASEGCSTAQCELGKLFVEGGNGIEKNYHEALKWLYQATPNSSDACGTIGHMLMMGYGVEKDLEKAESWLEKAIALNPEKALAYCYRGHIRYKSVPGMPHVLTSIYFYFMRQPLQKALSDYTTAVELGCVEALKFVGKVHLHLYSCASSLSDYSLMNESAARALHYFQQANNAGDPEAISCLDEMGKKIHWNTVIERYDAVPSTRTTFYMGVMYINGWHVQKNVLTGIRYLTSAVEDGHEEALTTLNETMEKFGLALLLEASEYLKKDEYSKAYGIYEPMAKAGNKEAKQAIAFMAIAKLIPKIEDDNLFLICFEYVANKGNGDAAFELADWYANRGSEENFKVAIKWYEEAYRLGINKASFELGKLHMNHWFSKAEALETKKWLEIAVAQHIDGAQQKLDEAKKKLESWFLF